jgi:tRNA threonylcarbamoyladenosine biosynthesis protein TsaB
MTTLVLRTDNPEAEIGIFKLENTKHVKQLSYKKWQAHRHLSETLLPNIKSMLDDCALTFKDVDGIICFEGPGSFTGLRIGLSTANALAYGLNIPIVGSSSEDWIEHGINKIKNAQSGIMVMPHYGAPVHITTPKK